MFSKSLENRHLFVLKRGEPLVSTLTKAVTELNIRGGVISGLGALMNVELGYYELEKKEYIRKTFSEEDYELISLTGNLSLREGQPYLHVHAALGRSDFTVFGGHLFEAVVAVTVEVTMIPYQFMPTRELDSDLGLGIICKVQ